MIMLHCKEDTSESIDAYFIMLYQMPAVYVSDTTV